MFTIKNLGSTLVYLVFLVLAYFSLIITSIMYGLFGIWLKLNLFIKRHMKWNFTLRLLIQQYQPLVMYSIINLYHLKDDLILYKFSSLVTFFVLVVIVQWMIPIMSCIIHKYDKLKALDSLEFKGAYGAITDGLTVSGFVGKYWMIHMLIRWTIVSIILVALRDYSTFQILLNIVYSWFSQVLIVIGKPLENRFENKMLMFNELMVSIYLYILISLTDYNDNADLFENCGIALLSIVIISFVVNFLKFLFFTLRDLFRRVR